MALRASQPTTAEAAQIRSIFRAHVFGSLALLVLFWLIELLVSPFGRPWAISLAILLPLAPVLMVLRARSALHRWVRVALLTDALALTIGIHFGGGVDNVSAPALYTVIIGLAGILLTPADTFLVTGAIVLLYDGLVLAEWAGALEHQVPYSRPPDRQFSTVVALDLYLMLLAWIVSTGVAQVRARHRQLEEQRRDAVHGMAHDLKNPLAVIRGYVQLLRNAGNEERPRYSDAIEHSAILALDLVSNIVDAATLEERSLVPQTAPLELDALIDEVVSRYRLAAKSARVELLTEIEATLPPAEVDGQMVARAVSNLVSNAIKYGAKGGTVRVAARVENGQAVIAVIDGGPGLSPSEQQHLFEKYNRTKAALGKEGSGLGLFIVRTIAEAHGGSVSVASEPGKGSAFTLSLPLVARSPA